MKKYILSLISSALLTVSLFSGIKIFAGSTQTRYYYGDVNNDGIRNIVDLILMKNELINPSKDYLTNRISDINKDSCFDIIDFLMFYKYLLGITDELPDESFIIELDSISPFIPSSVSDANASTQSSGKAGALIIYAEFNDAQYTSDKLSEEELNEEYFGDGKTEFPFESVPAYLERSSYGNFTVYGDVFYCKLDRNLSEYSSEDRFEALIIDVLNELDSRIDLSDYDADSDGDIDIISVTVPLDNADEYQKELWRGCSSTWYYNPGFYMDNTQIIKYINNDVMPYYEDMFYSKQTFLHELGHCMGLPDYYKYQSDDWEGLKGNAGFCRMDDSIGDFCSFSKLMLGWLKESEVNVFNCNNTSEKYVLKDASRTGNCIILPVGDWDGSFTQEYFLVEYVTDSENNFEVKEWNSSPFSTDMMSGIRVFHVNSEMYVDYWGRKDFKYNNYSDYYNGDDRQRVLRLVNDEKHGFYKTGDIISNLKAYDNEGYETVDTGYTIMIEGVSEEGFSIEITHR